VVVWGFAREFHEIEIMRNIVRVGCGRSESRATECWNRGALTTALKADAGSDQ
jgi:hypothetical protein